jgi:hypothetical protein
MNISQCAAQTAVKCCLKGQRRKHSGLSFTAQNSAHKPPTNKQGLLFNIEKKPFWVGGPKMKKIIDGTYLDEESEDNEIRENFDMEDCWDIEDRLYEQFKEKQKMD